jgi:hypothetical protein
MLIPYSRVESDTIVWGLAFGMGVVFWLAEAFFMFFFVDDFFSLLKTKPELQNINNMKFTFEDSGPLFVYTNLLIAKVLIYRNMPFISSHLAPFLFTFPIYLAWHSQSNTFATWQQKIQHTPEDLNLASIHNQQQPEFLLIKNPIILIAQTIYFVVLPFLFRGLGLSNLPGTCLIFGQCYLLLNLCILTMNQSKSNDLTSKINKLILALPLLIWPYFTHARGAFLVGIVLALQFCYLSYRMNRSYLTDYWIVLALVVTNEFLLGLAHSVWALQISWLPLRAFNLAFALIAWYLIKLSLTPTSDEIMSFSSFQYK